MRFSSPTSYCHGTRQKKNDASIKTGFSLTNEGTGRQPLGPGQWSLPLRLLALFSGSCTVVSVGQGETPWVAWGRLWAGSWVLCRILGWPLAKVKLAPRHLGLICERKGEPHSSDDRKCSPWDPCSVSSGLGGSETKERTRLAGHESLGTCNLQKRKTISVPSHQAAPAGTHRGGLWAGFPLLRR